MQFGMPTLIENKSTEACAALCNELELAFVELNMNLPEYQVDRMDVEQLRRIAEKHNIFYTIHLDENLNPCDFDDRVSASYTATVLQTIETAKRLSAPVLNMHLSTGVYFTLPDKKVFLFDEYETDYLQKLTTFRDKCETAIGGTEIKICVENCNGYNCAPFMRKGLELLLQSPVFALTFDVGHNAAADYTDEPKIMEHIDRLCHMHIHDARGRRNHLVLGAGDVNLGKYLDLAKKHDCRTVIEVKTVEGLRRSIELLKVRGYL